MYNVLVTGVGGPAGMASIQSLRIAPEPLRIAGVDMDPMAPGLLISDYASVVPSCTSPGYVPKLLSLCSRWKIDIIIPTVDEEVSVLARESGRFRSIGVEIPIPAADKVDLARDKLRIAGFDKFGLDVPRTFAFDSTSGLKRMLRELGLPCVLKQRIGRGGRGFAVIDAIGDATYWRNKRTGEDLILQRKIEGDLLLVQGIARGGRLLVSIVHRRLAVKGPGSGTATAAVTVKDATASELLRKVVGLLQWEGAIGVEFILDPGSRRYYLIDINPRICGQSHLSTMAGLNLAYGIVELARGAGLTVGPSYRSGIAFIRTWSDEAVRFNPIARIGASGHHRSGNQTSRGAK